MTLNCHIADLPEAIQDKFAEFRKIDVAAFGNLVWNIHHLFRDYYKIFCFQQTSSFWKPPAPSGSVQASSLPCGDPAYDLQDLRIGRIFFMYWNNQDQDEQYDIFYVLGQSNH